MLAAGALAAINIMARDPGMFADLQEKCREVQRAFSGLPGLSLHGDEASVVKHLRLREATGTREGDKDRLNRVVLEVNAGMKRKVDFRNRLSAAILVTNNRYYNHECLKTWDGVLDRAYPKSHYAKNEKVMKKQEKKLYRTLFF